MKKDTRKTLYLCNNGVKPTVVGEVFIEELYHFNCPKCSRWWTVGDLPREIESIQCPFCSEGYTIVRYGAGENELRIKKKYEHTLSKGEAKSRVLSSLKEILKNTFDKSQSDDNFVLTGQLTLVPYGVASETKVSIKVECDIEDKEVNLQFAIPLVAFDNQSKVENRFDSIIKKSLRP